MNSCFLDTKYKDDNRHNTLQTPHDILKFISVASKQLTGSSRTVLYPSSLSDDEQICSRQKIESPKASRDTKTGDAIQEESLSKQSRWKLGKVALPVVPPFYPLERTHVIVPVIIITPGMLAALISFACQRLSLAADFDVDNATANLTASDGTCIVLRLFSSGNGDTIVETQKMSGESETFYYNSSKLLQVSKGVKHITNMKSHIIGELHYSIVDHALFFPQDMQMELHLICDELILAAKLLENERVDSCELGLHILKCLTDSNKSSAMTCREASYAILSGKVLANNASSELFILKSEVIFETVFEPLDTSAEADESDYFQKRHCSRKRNQALEILSNVLQVCMQEKGMCIEKGDILSSFWLFSHLDFVISSMINIVLSANIAPHEAVLATKCIHRLIVLSPKAHSKAIRMDILEVLHRAHKIGQCTHHVLAVETQVLYDCLMGQERSSSQVL